MGVEFGLLGPLRVRVDGVPVPIGSSRVSTLLAALLTWPNEVVSVERLAGCLWGESRPAPRDARAATQTYVKRLRVVVGKQVVRTEQGGYRAVVDEDSLDVLAFDALLRRSRTAAPDQAAQYLDDALGLWRGTPFDGIDSELLQRDHVPPLLERGLIARRRWTEAHLAIGDHDRAIAELSRLTREFPLQEGLHELLMLALYRAGRRADALLAYRRVSGLLADELGIDPGAALRQLHQSILTEDPAIQPVSAEQTGVDLPPPAQLPADVAGFVGRAVELKELDGLLPEGDQTGVVVGLLSGGAGAGKTSLAVRWAHQVADRFADGQLYVDLRGWSAQTPMRPIDALAGFLAALGVNPERVPPDEAQAAALFRSLVAHRQLLVVLDNAASAAQVRPLLPAGAGSLVLVTSRNRLDGLVASTGAQRIDLDVLPPADAVEVVTTGLGAEAGDVEALAAACAYLPLALRITVANVLSDPARGVAGYLAELSGRDPMPALEVDDDPETAVRTAFDRSYQRLADAAQRVFRLIGRAPGTDLGVAAAAALAGTSEAEVARLLRVLTAAHLVQEHVPGRYTCHDLLRAFAGELARADQDAENCVQLLLDWYLRSADNAVHAVDPIIARVAHPPLPDGASEPFAPADYATARSWLDAERQNLIAAVRGAADAGSPDVGWRLGYVLRGYFHLIRQVVAWADVAQAAMAAADVTGTPLARASALANLSHMHQCAGDLARSIDLAEEALPLVRQVGWVDGELVVLSKLAIAHQHVGRLPVAADHHRRLLDLLSDERKHDAAVTLDNLGTVSELMGRLADAVDYSSLALDIYRRHGDDVGIALASFNVGTAEHQRGHFAAAGSYLATALSVSRRLKYRLGETLALLATARLHRDAGRLIEATETANEAVAQAADTGDRIREVRALNARGSIRLLTDVDAAADDYEHALAVAEAARVAQARVETLTGLATVARLRGDLPAARRHIRQALELAADVGCHGFAARAHIQAAEIDLLGGNPAALAAAKEHAARAVAGCRELEQRVDLVRALTVQARAGDAHHDDGAARRTQREAMDLAVAIGLAATPRVAQLAN